MSRRFNRNGTPTHCAYCDRPAVNLWRKRSALAGRKTFITYVGLCNDHADYIQRETDHVTCIKRNGVTQW